MVRRRAAPSRTMRPGQQCPRREVHIQIPNSIGHDFAVSRRMTPKFVRLTCPRKVRGRRECRVKASPMARLRKKCRRQVPQVQPINRHSPRGGLNAYTCSPRGSAVLSPSSTRRVQASSPTWPQHREARPTRFHVRITVVRRHDQVTLRPDTATASPPRIS